MLRQDRKKFFPLLPAATLLALLLLACASPHPARAQCAMCKASASALDGPGAKNLNYAILVLLCPPVAIFCAIFVVAYRRREPPGGELP
jgi:hypothetical protein